MVHIVMFALTMGVKRPWKWIAFSWLAIVIGHKFDMHFFKLRKKKICAFDMQANDKQYYS